MKRALPITVSIIALLGAGALIGPSFIDWNKYKPQIIAQAKSAAGYDVTIDGDIHLTLLPSPQLKLEGLTVAAPRGSEPNLLTMKQANVSVALMPLLSGAISVDTVRLVNPDIRLEVLPNGSSSWMSDKMLADKSGTGASAEGTSSPPSPNKFDLDKIIIEDGRVSYSNRPASQQYLAENINITVDAGSLQGPFDIAGSAVYGGKKIDIRAKTERPVGDNNELATDLKIDLPDSNANLGFNGVVAQAPLEVQGKLELNADNIGDVLELAGVESSAALARKLAFSGLVTLGEDTLQSEEMDVTFGDATGKGNLKIFGLKDKKPVTVNGNVAFEGILNLDGLAPKKDKSKEPSVEEKVAKGQKLSPGGTFIPETLALPFPVDGALQVTAEGIQTGGKTFKGVVAGLTKEGSAIDVTAKAIDMPSKTTAEATAALRYTGATGAGEGVNYTDPSVTFKATGSSQQLPTLLRAFVGEGSGDDALEIWKTGQFDVSGSVTPSTITVSNNSTVRLDQTNIALAASYKPNGAQGRPDIMLDLTTDTVDIDYIQSRLNGQNKQAVQKESQAWEKDLKKTLAPVRNFSVPYNLTFDLSAQKAILNAQQITGIRIKGKAAGSSLNLEVASAQDYMGAAASLRGRVGNMADLSGLDLEFYGKTDDLKSLMQTFKMDASKVPQSISAAEANISAKGTAENLAFDGRIKALNGELNAAGTATGILEKPSFTNLRVGAKHPNLVKAIQILNPQFTGGPGLERPFSFDANAVQQGKTYDLSGVKASLGSTTLTGDLKIATGEAKPSVTGSIQAGTIPLDDFLGAKNSAAKSSSASPSTGGDGGKWSRTTIETGWMHTVNMDLALSAQSILYGGWNFQKPTTKIVLKDGNLNLTGLQAGLFGGTANLDAKVQDPADPKQPLSLAVDSKMEGVALEPLMAALSGPGKVKASGDVSLNFTVQSTGLSSHALMSALHGKANVYGKTVVFKGFDLAQIGLAFVDTGKPMDRLNSIVGGATQSGETRFDTVDGAYDIQQGIVRITAMAMDGPSANIISKGSANLPAWTIDTIHTITFKQAKEAGAFDVAIKGSLSNPGNTFGRGLFNDVLTRRLQQKAIDKLPDVLGKDLSGKLEKFGILPQKTPKPAPAPVQGDTVVVPVNPAQQSPVVVPEPSAPSQQQRQAPAQQDAIPPAEQAPAQNVPAEPAPTEQAKPPAAPPPQSLEDQIKDDPAGAMEGILNSLGQ